MVRINRPATVNSEDQALADEYFLDDFRFDRPVNRRFVPGQYLVASLELLDRPFALGGDYRSRGWKADKLADGVDADAQRPSDRAADDGSLDGRIERLMEVVRGNRNLREAARRAEGRAICGPDDKRADVAEAVRTRQSERAHHARGNRGHEHRRSTAGGTGHRADSAGDEHVIGDLLGGLA